MIFLNNAGWFGLAGGAMVLFGALSAQAQVSAADSSAIATASNNLQTHYLASVGGHSYLYNGPEYVYSAFNVTGHPYLDSDKEQVGEVHYEGYNFTGVPMWYDIRQDVLVIKSYGSPARLKLVNEKLTSFNIAGRRFVRLVSDGGKQNPISTGFYEVLFEGGQQLRVLAKRAKLYEKSSSQGRVTGTFVTDDKFFVFRDAEYHQVTSLSSVLALFKDKKKELKKYAKAQKLEFKKGRKGEDFARVVAYYVKLAGNGQVNSTGASN